MSNNIEIESNITIPRTAHRGRPKSPLRVALESLAPDQSFVSPDSFRPQAYNIARDTGIQIKIRSLGGGQCRIWRSR